MTAMTESLGLLGLTCQIFLSFVFGAAAVHKLRDAKAFVETLRDYQLIPSPLLGPVSALVIGLEVFVVFGLWPVSLRTEATVTAAALLVSYAVAIGVNLGRGRREIDCGCSWGESGQTISWGLVFRNGLMLLPCWVVIMSQEIALSVETTSRAIPETAGLAASVVALAAAAVLLFCYWGFERLIANQPALARLRGERAE